MKHKIAQVNNIRRLSEAGTALRERAIGLPGMGILWGPTGAGKSTAAAWWNNQVNAVYVRALAVWTPSAMLGTIMRELGKEPLGRCAAMVSVIVEQLMISNRPLILDEADYIVEDKRMVETLRDLHDMATVPVILIGMEGIQRKISHREQLAGRIAQWVAFEPADLSDVHVLHRELCEVTIADELLEALHAAAKGSVRLIVVGMARIEAHARARGLGKIGPREWGKNDFFFGQAARPQAKPKLEVA